MPRFLTVKRFKIFLIFFFEILAFIFFFFKGSAVLPIYNVGIFFLLLFEVAVSVTTYLVI
jgi:hypothetical protein